MPIDFLSYVWCHMSNGTRSSVLWYGLCTVKFYYALFVVVYCCVFACYVYVILLLRIFGIFQVFLYIGVRLFPCVFSCVDVLLLLCICSLVLVYVFNFVLLQYLINCLFCMFPLLLFKCEFS